MDNNGEPGECEVSDEELNEEEKEEKAEEERGRSKVLGKWGFGKRNKNGKRLIEECAANGWSIANTFSGLPQNKKWSFYGGFHGRRHREYDQLTRKSIVNIQISEIPGLIRITVCALQRCSSKAKNSDIQKWKKRGQKL